MPNLFITTISDICNNGNITLDKKIASKKPLKVKVSFEEEVTQEEKRLTLDDFSFFKSRELLTNVKGNLSDAVVEERRSDR